MDGDFPIASTNAVADAAKTCSPSKESPAISPLVKAVQDSMPEKVEDAAEKLEEESVIEPVPEKVEEEIVGDKAKAVENTEEKKTNVVIPPMSEQKKEEGKKSAPSTVQESSPKKLTFEQAKATRAKRFGIPVHTGKRLQGDNDKNKKKGDSDKKKKKQKTGKSQQLEADNAKISSQTSGQTSLQELKDSTVDSAVARKETEQRIKRIERFGEGTSSENKKKIDELKAKLRTYRFTKETKV